MIGYRWFNHKFSRAANSSKKCDAIWSPEWRRSIKSAIGTLYNRSKKGAHTEINDHKPKQNSDETFILKTHDDCLPAMSNFQCVRRNRKKSCEITLHDHENYVGNLKVIPDLRNSQNSSICKLSFLSLRF